ncbi:MAG: hypothetical protein CVV64_19415 [Candidatus Wallbacteria bacterium HGW-Wallbacteria-1]|uniref:Cytosolic protein n=1 Tax=Candidatus Wallbacteria bacterium HGW-Wallbacteria-1 TaxID=2013854 RepID=A0A2N1PJ03_9BACT|nr:MAG: hypothetical protein CVV64_19415 [Candidatus Wallbacteria bacterium HGW-Wallbacteria-1]
MACPATSQNMKNCNCTWEPCPRKGNCCQCLEYHRNKGELPACYFTAEQEKTYNRSIRNFVKCNS